MQEYVFIHFAVMGLYRISYILPLLFVFYSLIRMKKAGEVLCVYIDIYMESERHKSIFNGEPILALLCSRVIFSQTDLCIALALKKQTVRTVLY